MGSVERLPTLLKRFFHDSAELMLEVRPNVLFASLLIGLIVMVLFSSKPLQSVDLDMYRTRLLDLIAAFSDVGAMQIGSIAVLVLLAVQYFRKTTSISTGEIVTVIVTGLIFGYGAEIAMQRFFIEPSFKYGDTLAHAHAPMTRLRWMFIGIGDDEKLSAPSGFVLRQTIIMLNFLLLSHQTKWRDVFSRIASRNLHWMFYAVFCLTIFQRVYNGRHTLFDIGTAIGVAMILFWSVVLCFAVILNPSISARSNLRRAILPLASYGMTVLFYCQETQWWIWVLLTIFASMALLERFRSVPIGPTL